MAASDSRSVEEKKRIYDCMSRYVFPSYSLGGHGYPTMNASGRVTVQDTDRKAPPALPNPNQRLCYRCRTRFTINSNGTFTPSETCVYHLGGVYRGKHTCCAKANGSTGCQTARSHVHRANRYLDLEGYVKTTARPVSSPTYDVYCVDCEMIYTSHGLELAHVTLVDTELRTVMDELVKPSNPVVEWNTRFSGITADIMKDVTTTLADIQKRLLELCDERTILIGHSPEFDHIALKLVHGRTVDTADVFTDLSNPGRKRALKDLVREKLGRTIQDNRGLGHDSKEDAVACMELMMWKIKQDLRRL